MCVCGNNAIMIHKLAYYHGIRINVLRVIGHSVRTAFLRLKKKKKKKFRSFNFVVVIVPITWCIPAIFHAHIQISIVAFIMHIWCAYVYTKAAYIKRNSSNRSELILFPYEKQETEIGLKP